MGARNSIPQTAKLDNPDVVHLSPATVSRLRGTQKQAVTIQQEMCKNCAKNKNTEGKEATGSESILKNKTIEVEESQFQKTLERLESLIGKPLNWTDEFHVELKDLEHELLHCMKAYPKESLKCADEAKRYKEFVQMKQFESIIRILTEPSAKE